VLKLSLLSVALPLMIAAASGQTPAPVAPQASPKAAYDDAMRPLQITRNSIENWSETETAALGVTIEHAAAECLARDPKTFAGEDLVDLMRLCALGQTWPATVRSANLYIAAKDIAKPRLNQAYAAMIDALLHLHDEHDAFMASKAILTSVPYDALCAEVIDEAIAYMQFSYTADAITLAEARQPLLLARLQALTVPPAASNSVAPVVQTAATDPPQSLYELYADGLCFAELQQLDKQPAEATVAALDATLTATLAPDDALRIAALRRRYALLGQPLPKLAATTWVGATTYLGEGGKVPELPVAHTITALLLFPDWCAQCVRMGADFPKGPFMVSGHDAFFYGLLAETYLPETGKQLPVTPAFAPEDAAALLTGTPTLAVNPTVLNQFTVTDPPFLIIADAQGIIRVLQPVTEDAMAPRNTVDSAIALVGSKWGVERPTPKPDAAPDGAKLLPH
jgi:hypothetical protein